MGLFRKGDDDESPRRKYQMREKLMSIGDDYWIEDDAGNKAFKVDGKAMRMRDTWVLEDAHGNEVAKIREKKLSIRDTIKIELRRPRGHGEEGDGRHPRPVHVEVDGGKDLKVHGNIVDHEYEIDRDGDKIAEISKKWFRDPRHLRRRGRGRRRHRAGARGHGRRRRLLARHHLNRLALRAFGLVQEDGRHGQR